MKQNLCIATAAAVVAGLAGAANAGFATSITADNHYALYYESSGIVSFIGANESGSGGSPGQYNWSEAETWNVQTPGEFVYIAAWSDDSVAQGLIANMVVDGFGAVHSGDVRWEVFATGIDLDDGSPAPSGMDIAAQVGFASMNNLWGTPFVGGANGSGPWGTIAGISMDARWMWAADPGRTNNGTLEPGGDHDEYLIFRLQVPTPGSAAALGLIGVGAMRRRRA